MILRLQLHRITKHLQYRNKSLLNVCRFCDIQHGYNTRKHSTKSDNFRQKAVLETSTPKIVLDKLDKLDEKIQEAKVNNGIFKNKFFLWKDAATPFVQLMRLDKPIGIWLLYWPCTWSIALSTIQTGVPLSVTADNLLLFLTGAVLMRGAGCTINDLWDRDIDAKVERTKSRPLVSGAISQKQAIAFLAMQLSGGLAVLLQLNWYSVALGASSMALVITYPLAKRFTNYPQLFLGATFNWGALLGYSAIAGHVDPAVCVPLYMAAVSWTMLYDTVYAHQDKLDDARIGIKSTALTFGDHSKPILSGVAATSMGLFAVSGFNAGLGWPFYAGLAMAATHAGRQIYTLNPDSPADCASKFRSNTWIGCIIFLSILFGGYQQYSEKNSSNQKEMGS